MDTPPIRCPDCGNVNPADARACLACGFPLGEGPAPPRPDQAGAPDQQEAQRPLPPLPPRLRRPRRPPRMEPVATRLYLVFGVIVAATLLYIALSENLKRGSQQVQVEGASEQQLKRAQELRDLLARDSTNVEARTQLGNVLYDTGNWKDAIPQYVFVLGRDSTRVPVLVDIGVCYFNLSQPDVAESYFKKALVLDPHQSVAHFNMGIVRESRRDFAGAMSAYHLALEASPSDELRQAVLAAMQRIQQQTGKAAPPLDQTAPQPPSK